MLGLDLIPINGDLRHLKDILEIQDKQIKIMKADIKRLHETLIIFGIGLACMSIRVLFL